MLPIENSTSTLQSFSLVELSNCDLLILRYGLENNTKVRASNTVLLPAPLLPDIKTVDFSWKSNSIY